MIQKWLLAKDLNIILFLMKIKMHHYYQWITSIIKNVWWQDNLLINFIWSFYIFLPPEISQMMQYFLYSTLKWNHFLQRQTKKRSSPARQVKNNDCLLFLCSTLIPPVVLLFYGLYQYCTKTILFTHKTS